MNTSRYVKREELPNPRVLRGVIKLAGTVPNDSYIIGVPKIIFRDQSVTKLTNGGNVGGGLDTIFAFTLLANSLKNDGDIFDVFCAGAFATNDNNKRIAAGFGPATIEDTSLRDIDGLGWYVRARISRVSATTAICSNYFESGAMGEDSAGASVGWAIGANNLYRSTPLTGGIALPNLNANDTGFIITAEGTADDDIVIRQAIMTLTRFS